MLSVYQLIPPFNPADIIVGPDAPALNTLPGHFLTPWAYELNMYLGIAWRWDRATEAYRFSLFSATAEAHLREMHEKHWAPRGALLVRARTKREGNTG